jgi:hypothetical protein
VDGERFGYDELPKMELQPVQTPMGTINVPQQTGTEKTGCAFVVVIQKQTTLLPGLPLE